MKVYHGSTIIVREPLANVGRRNLDFGEGFYVTDLREQAISWAQRPSNRGKAMILNAYELDLDKIIAAGYRFKQFDAYDTTWLEFVVANRRGLNEWKNYDIIEGGIANDRVFNTIELYIAGLTPQEGALKRLQYEQPNNQICILNQEIIDKFLHFIEAVEIGKEEIS
jgi:hypothetical protein